jgi:hypothetical protein
MPARHVVCSLLARLIGGTVRFGLRLAGLALVGLLSFGTTATAAPILVVNGPNDNTTTFSNLINNLGVGFTTTTDLVNVSLDFTVVSFNTSATIDVNAFLTTQVGPGTTAAHEVASSSTQFSTAASGLLPPYTFTTATLFSGLSLSAGSYFLTVQPVSGTAFWVSSPSSSAVITASGASLTSSFLSAFADQAYFPANTFGGVGDVSGPHLWFSVSGDLASTGDAVPEPATLALLGSGLAAVAAARRRRRRS